MRRRDFITLLAGAMGGLPSVARAQQKAKPVIGLLMPVSSFAPLRDATRQGLAETGFVAPAQWGEHAEGRAEGQNVAIEYRLAEGHYDRLPALAADLVGRKVDVILTIGGELPARAAKGATSTIPIVSIFGADPVDAELVASLARPGGNLTGFTLLSTELTAKTLELLSELVPQAGVVALLVDPDYPQTERITRDAQQAARAKRGCSSLSLKPAPQARSTRLSRPSSNCMPARSSLAAVLFISSSVSSSSHWRHAMPFRRSMVGASSPKPAA